MQALTSKPHALPLFLLALTIGVLVWSGINPHDRPTWWLEVAPVLVAIPLLIATYRSFRLTSILYVLIAVHCIILMVGGHYTYALVPLFDMIRDWLGTARNSYDGLGHFAQGFVPAMIGRELLIRTSALKTGKWLPVVIVLSCLGISALYELLEWATALAIGASADDFLGTQNDPWDTQKDMALAGVGAALALLILSSWHNRQLAQLQKPQ